MMSEKSSMAMLIFSGLLAALSQLLLKKSAMSDHKNKLTEYMNSFVIGSYLILFMTTLINMVAMRSISYKFVPVLGTVSYIFIIILSKLVLKEKIKSKKWIGIILIMFGIIVFNL